MPEQYHVFMSYSRVDTAMMRRVTGDLRREGFKVWNDEALEPGTDSWKTEIQTAIETSAIVVVLLSPDAKKSEWIERELDYARAFQVQIVPVIIRGDAQTAVPFLLISEQYADVRHDYQAGFRALQDALCDIVKLPELCPDPQAPSATIDETPVSSPVSQNPPRAVQPMAFAGTLHVWNPIDYVKLMGLYLFDPVGLNTYEPKASRALAVWLASTLFWLPLAINALFYGLSDIPFWGFGQEPLGLFPSWVIPIAWFLTGLLGQIYFGERTGLWAFLRGPLQIVVVIVGLGAAVLYGGSILYAQPVLETHNGLVFLLASQAQQMLIIAGGLSVFVGAILAATLARGAASWLGLWLSIGFIGLYGLLLYFPLGESLVPLLPADTSQSDATVWAIMAYSSVTCCLGVLLLITATTIGGALRRRQVGRFNFLLLAMLIAAYGMFVSIHILGRA